MEKIQDISWVNCEWPHVPAESGVTGNMAPEAFLLLELPSVLGTGGSTHK